MQFHSRLHSFLNWSQDIATKLIQWIECPPVVGDAMGSIPVGTQVFSLFLARNMLNISSFTNLIHLEIKPTVNKPLIYSFFQIACENKESTVKRKKCP